MTAAKTPAGIPATSNSRGKNGLDIVRQWPGGWKPADHVANVTACVRLGLLAPWTWVPVRVAPDLVVYVASDALAIGDSPRCRIPLGASNYQRLLDTLSAQLGASMLFMTPKISDARHLTCVLNAATAGRLIEPVSIWGPGAVPEPVDPATRRPKNRGADTDQWLRQQERVHKAIVAAGGYPASGIVSTLGKDVTLGPRSLETTRPDDFTGGREWGAKLSIYGWHQKTPPPKFPQLRQALAAAGWPSVQQDEIFSHIDSFWDYSQVLVPVLDACTYQGKAQSLAAIYQHSPHLVYEFGALNVRPIPARYPPVPVPIAS